MAGPARFCLVSSGLFLMFGLLTGIWKYWQIRQSPERRAHVYVDIAHRASFLYSFACLVMKELVSHGALSLRLQWLAVVAPIAFFAAAVLTYVFEGFRQRRDNQLEQDTALNTGFMLLLIIAECGGVGLLLYGLLSAP